MTNHNKVCYKVAYLARKAFTTSHVLRKPLIHTVLVMRGMKTQMVGQKVPNNLPLVTVNSE